MTNRRVAEEIMGLCLHPKMSVRFGGMIECVDCGVPVSGPNQPLDYSTDLNHARLAWDKLSEDEKDYVDEYMIDVGPHKRKEDNYLDAGVLCEAMLSAKESDDE